MKQLKWAFLILGLLIYNSLFSQEYSNNWNEYYSYYKIQDVVYGNGNIYAAAENAVFIYNPATLDMEEITTLNGLSGEYISTIHYSETYGLLLIGYENGLIDVYMESNQNVLTVVDIFEKPTIPLSNKRINHFNEYGDIVYISTDYGISVYNLENLEFGDTYYIGNLGSQINIKQTTIHNGYIYAACQNANGLKKAVLTNPNLIDYQEWEQVTFGNYLAIQEFSGELYGFRNDRRVFSIADNNTISEIFMYDFPPLDVKVSENKLLVTTVNDVYIYDIGFSLLSNIDVTNTNATAFTSATTDSNNIYIGTQDLGVLTSSLSDLITFTEVYPEGPLSNKAFDIEVGSKGLWAVFGGYSVTYNFNGGVARTGISHYVNEGWNNITYDTLAQSVTNPRYLSNVTINPNNPSQVFVCSYYSGLLEIDDEEVVGIFNQGNSTIVPFEGNLHLTLVSAFDANDGLWVMNGRVSEPLNRFINGQWTSYDFGSIILEPTQELGFSDIVVDRSGNKWIGGYSTGVIGFNENNGSDSPKTLAGEESNMPSDYVRALAIDQRNNLWIGTRKGLRVLYNTSGFFDDESPEASSIIVEVDGEASELLYEQFVSAIEVDGSNNKWVGTFNSGLFYFSNNGQETIYHFTKDNSPLPSNNIMDISIDQSNGEVFIATDKGLLSFSSGSSGTKDSLTDAYVYPNPVRPGFNITEEKVKIKDISDNVNIKITDIEGNLVAEAQSRTNLRYKGYNLEIDGGTAFWNGRNLANNVVASGVYLIMLTDLDTLETNVLKVMVVR